MRGNVCGERLQGNLQHIKPVDEDIEICVVSDTCLAEFRATLLQIKFAGEYIAIGEQLWTTLHQSTKKDNILYSQLNILCSKLTISYEFIDQMTRRGIGFYSIGSRWRLE